MNCGRHSLKAVGTNFDHFFETFPHGRVDFVWLGGLTIFCMETLIISAWKLEVNSIVVVFLQEFFTLDILGFGLLGNLQVWLLLERWFILVHGVVS